ncbi:MAG: zf-HC2 domain-containing protein [Chloroflexota bacterium]
MRLLHGWGHKEDKNDCRDVGALLSAYLDGKTDTAQTQRVEGHLATCAACRLELEQLRLLVSGLRALPALKPERSFALAAPPRVAAPAPANVLYLRRLAVSLAATLVMLFGLGLQLGQVPTFSSLAARSAPAAVSESARERTLTAAVPNGESPGYLGSPSATTQGRSAAAAATAAGSAPSQAQPSPIAPDGKGVGPQAPVVVAAPSAAAPAAAAPTAMAPAPPAGQTTVAAPAAPAPAAGAPVATVPAGTETPSTMDAAKSTAPPVVPAAAAGLTKVPADTGAAVATRADAPSIATQVPAAASALPAALWSAQLALALALLLVAIAFFLGRPRASR